MNNNWRIRKRKKNIYIVEDDTKETRIFCFLEKTQFISRRTERNKIEKKHHFQVVIKQCHELIGEDQLSCVSYKQHTKESTYTSEELTPLYDIIPEATS